MTMGTREAAVRASLAAWPCGVLYPQPETGADPAARLT